MFRKTLALSTAVAAASIGLMFGSAGVASASGNLPYTGYGFDGNAHLIVGGGSTTVYKIAAGFASLYESTSSCLTNNSNNHPASNPQSYPQGTGNEAYNQCAPASQGFTGVNAGGDYDGDTVAIAEPAGSSTGIGSLNGAYKGSAGTYAYEGTNQTLPTSGDPNEVNGTSNGFGTVDFALSSRGPKSSGGACAAASSNGAELDCDTFWGIAADGVEVFTFGSTVSSSADDTEFGPGLSALSGELTGTDLYNIWECNYTTWGQLPEYAAAAAAGAVLPPSNAPIVPWSMNSNSGTYSDFNTYVAANDGSLPFTMDDKLSYYSGTGTNGPTPAVAGDCARELGSTAGTASEPLENDIKPLLQDVNSNGTGGLSTNPLSTNNPANWIWAGSFGLLTAYPYLSQPALFGNQYNTFAVPVDGQLPNTAEVGSGSYPIERTLYVVTANADAYCPLVSGVCNLTGGPTNGNGVTDANVLGANGGKGGAVREFVRWLCRNKAESANGATLTPVDAYTGISSYNEITSTISGSSFTRVPTTSPGSACAVQSNGVS